MYWQLTAHRVFYLYLTSQRDQVLGPGRIQKNEGDSGNTKSGGRQGGRDTR